VTKLLFLHELSNWREAELAAAIQQFWIRDLDCRLIEFVMGLVDQIVVLDFGKRSPKDCQTTSATILSCRTYLGAAM
jgi:hypothetical protein